MSVLWLLIFIIILILAAGLLLFSMHRPKITGRDEPVTWETYDWSKHEDEHFDPEKGNRSYGLIILTPDKKVLMVKNRENMWGFPKGHRDEGENPLQAAIREIYEETGVPVPSDTVPKGEVFMEYDLTFSEEQLNRHIEKQIMRGERPHWNKPGAVSTKIIFYVIEIPEVDLEIKEEGKADGLLDVKWIPIEEAKKIIPESGSNQLPLLEKAIEI
jgi:8-oxo-dGTP pyrophosphatase MutT (NUDIX family)